MNQLQTAGGTDWTVVAAGIVIRKKLILAVKRPPGKILAGFWEFPGGKALPGEPAHQALSRELDEELGIIPSDFRLWTRVKKSYAHLNAHVHFYLIYKYEGQIFPRENQEMAWIDPARTCGAGFLKADRKILKRVVYHL